MFSRSARSKSSSTVAKQPVKPRIARLLAPNKAMDRWSLQETPLMCLSFKPQTPIPISPDPQKLRFSLWMLFWKPQTNFGFPPTPPTRAASCCSRTRPLPAESAPRSRPHRTASCEHRPSPPSARSARPGLLEAPNGPISPDTSPTYLHAKL